LNSIAVDISCFIPYDTLLTQTLAQQLCRHNVDTQPHLNKSVLRCCMKTQL
jgi:hypothetical protein